jgi:hypothetical protein
MVVLAKILRSNEKLQWYPLSRNIFKTASFVYTFNDKNSLWTKINIRKTELYVKA